jgi:hypothetical protein
MDCGINEDDTDTKITFEEFPPNKHRLTDRRAGWRTGKNLGIERLKKS